MSLPARVRKEREEADALREEYRKVKMLDVSRMKREQRSEEHESDDCRRERKQRRREGKESSKRCRKRIESVSKAEPESRDVSKNCTKSIETLRQERYQREANERKRSLMLMRRVFPRREAD